MTREEIISGLQFTIDMFLFDPNTGEKYTVPRNDMDKTTIDACRGAIELLRQEPTTKNDNEQEDITWIIGNDNVQIAVRNMPVDMMQKINAIIGNLQEPTTKNCESCKYYGSHHEVCNYCYKCSLWTEKEPTTKNDLGVDCISRKAVTLNNPCKDCSEKTWCGGFACKEAREYLDNKNKVNRSEQ